MGPCSPRTSAKSSPSAIDSARTSTSAIGRPFFESNAHKQKSILTEGARASKLPHELNKLRRQSRIDSGRVINIKAPYNSGLTSKKWISEAVVEYPHSIVDIKPEVIARAGFQEKLTWFRAQVEAFRKQYCRDKITLRIDRTNLIKSSLEALQDANMLKEFKIQFVGDKAEDSGRGLFRQWLHLCIQQIFAPELRLLEMANTDETAYRLVWRNQPLTQNQNDALRLLGLLIAKALIDNVSIGCYLDRTIVRFLCSQPVCLADVHSYDKDLFQAWSSILNTCDAEQLCLTGEYQHVFDDESSRRFKVVEGGSSTWVTESNKQHYISSLIDLHCRDSISTQLGLLQSSLSSIIPAGLLTVFQPHQLQTLLEGPPHIDLQDWKNNTVYDGYEPDDAVIVWFWEQVQQHGQQGYRNLLHFCTGSRSVPIAGFGELQSNYGHRKKFTIRKVTFESTNPCPRSYTCYNRLDLPDYATREQLKLNLDFILQEEFTYFGLS